MSKPANEPMLKALDKQLAHLLAQNEDEGHCLAN